MALSLFLTSLSPSPTISLSISLSVWLWLSPPLAVVSSPRRIAPPICPSLHLSRGSDDHHLLSHIQHTVYLPGKPTAVSLSNVLPAINLSVVLSTCLSGCFRMCIYLHVCLSGLSVCPYVCLSVCLSSMSINLPNMSFWPFHMSLCMSYSPAFLA